MKNSSRLLALLMAVLMTMSLFTVAVLASEEPVEEVAEPVEEIAEPVDEIAEPVEEVAEPAVEQVEFVPVPLEEATEAELPAVDGGTVTVSTELVANGVTQASVRVTVSSPASGVADWSFLLLYREKGQTKWNIRYISLGEITETSGVVCLNGLKESTTYEYRGAYEVFSLTGNEYEVCYTREKTVQELTTGELSSMETIELNNEVSVAALTYAEYTFTAPSDGNYLFTASDYMGMTLCLENGETGLHCLELKENDVVTVLVTNYSEESETMKVAAYTPLGVEDFELSLGTPIVKDYAVAVEVTYSVPLGKMAHIYAVNSANPYRDCWVTCYSEVQDGKETIRFGNLFPGYTYSVNVMLQEMGYTSEYGYFESADSCIQESFTVIAPSTVPTETISLGDKATEYSVYCFTAPEDGEYSVTCNAGNAIVGVDGEFSHVYSDDGSSYPMKKNDKMYIYFEPWVVEAYVTVTEAAEPSTQPTEVKITDLTVENGVATMKYEVPDGMKCDSEIILMTDDEEFVYSIVCPIISMTSRYASFSLKGYLVPGAKYKIVGEVRNSEDWRYPLAQKELYYTAPSAETLTVSLGETVEPESICLYAFTPTVTDWYTFRMLNISASLFDSNGKRIDEFYVYSDEVNTQMRLTADKTYYLIPNGISANSEFVVERFVPTVTEDRITEVTAERFSRDILRIFVTYDAKFTNDDYEIMVNIFNAEGEEIDGFGIYYESEAKGETLNFERELAMYVPGAVYSIEASILRDGEKTARLRSQEMVWPTYETKTLTLDVPSVYTGEPLERKMYSFTAPADGYYDFIGESMWGFQVCTAEGKGLCHDDCDYDDETGSGTYTFYLKQCELYYAWADLDEGGSLTVTKNEAARLCLTASASVVHPGDVVTVTAKTWENPGVTDMAFDIGARYNDAPYEEWRKECPYTSAQATTDELSWSHEYTVPETAENGDVIEFFVAFDPDKFAKNGSEDVEFEIRNATVMVDAHTPGDLNGDEETDLLDLVCLMRHLACGTACEPFAADTDGNGVVNAIDLILLMKYLTGDMTAVIK